MGSARPALLALALVLLLFWSVLPPTVGQGAAGHLVVSTDYELFGTSDLRGGGHVTWTLTGDKAADLRMKILHMFDEYAMIPRGFTFTSTSPETANTSPRLEAPEGVRYGDRLEPLLEASGRGTAAQYVEMYPFDPRDKVTNAPATSFDRSTVGLAGTDANTTGQVEIRFLFEANITTTEGTVPLATRALVDALYDGFSYHVIQSPSLTGSGPYPGSWPFLPGNGWHVTTFGGRQAFWAGNDTTLRYDNNMDASSITSADPALAAGLPFDSRFASRAWATFNYTGAVNGPGDYLRIEYAHPPAYTDWTNLSFGGTANLPSTAAGVWSNETVDLTGLLGQQARLRMRFHSDNAGTASGFYVRDFDVHAPAAYTGEVVESDTHYLIGTLILFYFVPTALWVIGVRAVVSGLIYWVLSVTLVLLIGFVTRASYRQHLEEAPPPVVDEESTVVRKIISPAPSSEASPVVGQCTHCLKEIHESDRTYRCTCGALFHFACASGLMRCPNCRKPIAAGVLSERKRVSLRCESCGELQTVLEGTDPRALTCANCGGRMRHLDVGKRYLIVASNPAIAITWMRDLVKGGKPALIMTHAAPDRLRLEFGVKKAPIVQISDRAPGAIAPNELDPAGLRAILPLAREGKGGAILYDGLDEMIAEGSLADVIRFLRKANDMAFVHGVTVIARVTPGRLAEPDLKRLNAEFDEFLDLSAQL